MGNDPKPDFSDVQGGSSTTAAPKPAAPDFSDVQGGSTTTAPAADATQTYTVVAGDTLSKIARKFYGQANNWNKIFQANKDQIKNPDMIRPGQVFKIPPK